MTRLRRLLVLVVLVIACALPSGGAQAADSRFHDNVADAFTEQDGAHVFDFAWDLRRERGDDPVDHLNAANAAARCTQCGARAIAFQIVLVSGSPDIVAPRNLARAITDQCTQCEVAAEARQFVRVLDAPVRFTGEGRAELAAVRNELRALEDQSLSLAQLDEQVERQEARVIDALDHELVLKSRPDARPEVLDKELHQSADLG